MSAICPGGGYESETGATSPITSIKITITWRYALALSCYCLGCCCLCCPRLCVIRIARLARLRAAAKARCQRIIHQKVPEVNKYQQVQSNVKELMHGETAQLANLFSSRCEWLEKQSGMSWNLWFLFSRCLAAACLRAMCLFLARQALVFPFLSFFLPSCLFPLPPPR